MEINLDDFKNKASKALVESVQALIDKLNSNKVAFTDNKKKQQALVFGKLNMSILLKEHIDPYLLLINKHLNTEYNLRSTLSVCSSLDFTSDEFGSYCDNLLFLSRKCANNIAFNKAINVSVDLSFIRLMLLNIQSVISKSPFKTCKVCFRRILVNKHCWLHKSESLDFYMQRKIHSYDSELRVFIERWKDKRVFLGELPNISPDHFGSSESVSAYKINAYVNKDIYQLIKYFSQPDWNKGKVELELFIKKKLPALYNILLGQTDKVDSFNDYVRRVYSPKFLDNRYESSLSELWFFFTLLEANLYFSKEEESRIVFSRKVDKKLERDKNIIKLRKEGLSYRDIAAQFKVSKSLVEKVCKGNR